MSNLRPIRQSRGLTQKQLADRLKVTEVSVSRYESQEQRLTLPLLRRLAKELRCSVADLAGESLARTAALTDEFALLPSYDLRASAGGGAFFETETETARVAFRRQWLKSVTNAPVDMLAVIQADGDSMEPTIHDGDHMLVDRTQTNPRRDGIYVVNWDGHINVKRVTTDPARKRIVVSSDNPRYPPNEAVKPDEIAVLGRVIWIGRRV
ncbi:MAG: helix-turn-helix transcriptional regulator [Alphaproteobacteria bacterium]